MVPLVKEPPLKTWIYGMYQMYSTKMYKSAYTEAKKISITVAFQEQKRVVYAFYSARLTLCPNVKLLEAQTLNPYLQ